MIYYINEVTEEMVNNFLKWPLPNTVVSDPCVSMPDYKFPRFGTSLLTAEEARKMLEYVLLGSCIEIEDSIIE